MDKLTAIKIKYDDGTYSDEIPVSVLGENVEWDNTHTLVDVLGSIDVDVTGTIQDQISQLFNEKVSTSAMQDYVTNSMPTYITNWLNTNVNPVGSAVVVDSSLTVSGAAADAKETGDEISDLKADLSNNASILAANNIVSFPDGSLTTNGVTYVANNGKLVANGTAIVNAIFPVFRFVPSLDGIYHISGCPLNGAISKYYLCFDKLSSSAYCDFGNGADVQLTKGTEYTLWAVVAKNNAVASNLTFVPSVVYKCIYDNNQFLDTVLGRNLFEIRNDSATSAGITFTPDGNGNVIANGTATNNAFYTYIKYIPLVSGKYHLSGCPNGGSKQKYFMQFSALNDADTGSGVDVQLTKGTEYTLWLVIINGQTVANLIFTPSIALVEYKVNDDINTLKDSVEDFEEWAENINTLDIPKAAYANLAKFARGTYVSASVNFVSDGVRVIVNGTANNNAIFTPIKFTPFYSGKYRIGGCPVGGSVTNYYMCINTLNTADFRDTGLGATVSLEAGTEYSLWIVVTSGNTVDNVVFNPYIYYMDELDEVIQTYDYKTNTVVLPSYYDDYMPAKIASIKDNINSVGRNGETFIFITDIHWEQNYKKSPILTKYILENTNVRLLLCGGDLINTQPKSEAKDLIYDIIKKFEVPDIPMHMTMGNHDSNELNWNTEQLRQQNMFSVNDVFGLTQKNTSYSNNYVSDIPINYYFDRADSKTRFIVLQTGIWDGSYTQETITALYDMLMSTPENYKIIIAEHWFFGGTTAAESTKITSSAELLMNMVNHYNAKDTYEAYDFTNAKGTVFLILSGHTHFDYSLAVDDSRNTSGVLVIATNCDSFRNNESAIEGTVTEQCFDVITLDYTNSEVRCVRIGRGENRTFTQ